jgi:hypothetical protein
MIYFTYLLFNFVSAVNLTPFSPIPYAGQQKEVE